MSLRVFTFLLVLISFTSCDKFSFTKSKKAPVLDTIVDFSSVDVYPSFKNCDSIIHKQKKADCFRATIHQKIGTVLKSHQFVIKDAINELVLVDLIINQRGNFILDTIRSSGKIKQQLPELDSLINESFANIPCILPAVKRGIPVTTRYQLPIKIELKE
ncbi:hypothetical protein [uncultured Polaribacter sp.]|uniref:hypothetical protein n=1 Tax=uncultured Polaribacter sp. TaxID=174711 RepID=UPI00260243A2|nr:hypothetical protein [uncultured Polaribacter sp.]